MEDSSYPSPSFPSYQRNRVNHNKNDFELLLSRKPTQQESGLACVYLLVYVSECVCTYAGAAVCVCHGKE